MATLELGLKIPAELLVKFAAPFELYPESVTTDLSPHNVMLLVIDTIGAGVMLIVLSDETLLHPAKVELNVKTIPVKVLPADVGANTAVFPFEANAPKAPPLAVVVQKPVKVELIVEPVSVIAVIFEHTMELAAPIFTNGEGVKVTVFERF